MNKEEIEMRAVKAKKVLLNSGAHYIADNICDLPVIIEEINQRIKNGESP